MTRQRKLAKHYKNQLYLIDIQKHYIFNMKHNLPQSAIRKRFRDEFQLGPVAEDLSSTACSRASIDAWCRFDSFPW